jgi:selenocysteine-specific elongation factor
MKGHSIIGTAGHIDHGKTALVKALTGIDVDTLAEEKRRGITIELGFAFMDSPGLDREVIFIDVPGHEKLIKTMVAGASNIDAALLVIAADEGINVQTIEHFEILQLFAIETGVIALTKSDLVDQERISRVSDEIRNMTAGTFLENAPVIPVSSITGEGIAELKCAIIESAKKIRTRSDNGVFRMPVDRVFTMQGFGAVIAGTILSGEVKVGDKLEILPEGLSARVRSIQVHAKSVQSSGIGTRTAINLQDVKKEQMYRGQCAVAPGSVSTTTRIDAQLQILRSFGEEVKNRTRVRFHVGTAEVMARAVLLNADKLAPGDSALVQFVLEEPTVILPKDRFVIRAFSSMQTMGGGVVLDATPEAHKRYDSEVLSALEKRQGRINDVIEQVFINSGNFSLSPSEVAANIGESEAEVLSAIDELQKSGRLVKIFPRNGSSDLRDPKREKYLCALNYEQFEAQFIGIIREFYARNPYRKYMPSTDLRPRFLKLSDKSIYEAILTNLCKEGQLQTRASMITLAERKIEWKPGEKELAGL